MISVARLFEAEAVVDVGDQERQRFQHAGQVFAGEAALHVGVGAHAHEHRVVFVEQLLHGDVLADLDAEAEFHAHAFQHFAAPRHRPFFQLEFGDAEGEQAADFRVAVEHHRRHAVAHQNVGAAQARRPGADDRDALAGRHDLAHVGPPARP